VCNKSYSKPGDKFFYESPSRMLNRAYGAIYMSDMSYQEFTKYLFSSEDCLNRNCFWKNIGAIYEIRNQKSELRDRRKEIREMKYESMCKCVKRDLNWNP